VSLRERLAEPEILVAVGAHDPFTALIAERSGAESIFLGGYSVAAHMHGLPDIGFLGLSDVVEVMERISAVSTIPVIVDADTGYGAEPGVRRTVARLERAGAAGIQFEDQITPKRCGFMAGKQLISKQDMVSKVRAAVEARSDEQVILIARTDALGVSGMDDAIERATAYAEAGADFVVVDAVRTRAEIEDLAARLDVPKVVPVPPTRDKPVPTVAELQELGYRIAVFPSTQGSWIMAKAYAALCEQIVESGTTGSLLDEFLDLDELFAITGREGWERPVTGEHFEPPGRTSIAIRSGAKG
jgi:2-methylisocitrate lyase-like PEP mutase family enzyme